MPMVDILWISYDTIQILHYTGRAKGCQPPWELSFSRFRGNDGWKIFPVFNAARGGCGSGAGRGGAAGLPFGSPQGMGAVFVQLLDIHPEMGIIKTRVLPRSGFGSTFVNLVFYKENRHLAEWRFSHFIRSVNTSPNRWNVMVIGMKSPPFGGFQTKPPRFVCNTLARTSVADIRYLVNQKRCPKTHSFGGLYAERGG